MLVTALPMGLMTDASLKDTFAGLWSGVCFALGLTIGGMVRPSAVIGALSPVRFDGTLWALFMTALATTFVFYRVSDAFGRSESRAPPSAAKIDASLILGSLLFGVGWGLGGVCPGPHVVNLGASPAEGGPWLMLLCSAVGMRLAQPIRQAMS